MTIGKMTYREVSFTGLSGYLQVTDAWQAELACGRGAKLATLDRGRCCAE